MDSQKEKIKQFCLIQMEIVRDRENRLRKEILDCNIQKEFLTDMLSRLDEKDD